MLTADGHVSKTLGKEELATLMNLFFSYLPICSTMGNSNSNLSVVPVNLCKCTLVAVYSELCGISAVDCIFLCHSHAKYSQDVHFFLFIMSLQHIQLIACLYTDAQHAQDIQS